MKLSQWLLMLFANNRNFPGKNGRNAWINTCTRLKIYSRPTCSFLGAGQSRIKTNSSICSQYAPGLSLPSLVTMLESLAPLWQPGEIYLNDNKYCKSKGCSSSLSPFSSLFLDARMVCIWFIEGDLCPKYRGPLMP